MVVNYYLVNLSFKFHEDPCINARARVVNALAREKYIQKNIVILPTKEIIL